MGKSPYALFKADEQLESKQGIRLDYGGFYLTIHRAGGSNKAYAKALQEKMRPFKRQLMTETMDEQVAQRLLVEVFAETVVIGWGSKEHGDGKIEGQEGKVLNYNRDNVIQLLTDLPDLFADVREASNNAALFRRGSLEVDAGN